MLCIFPCEYFHMLDTMAYLVMYLAVRTMQPGLKHSITTVYGIYTVRVNHRRKLFRFYISRGIIYKI